MSTLSGEACRAAGTLMRAAEAHRGGQVSYTAYHAYKLLNGLSREGPLGRPRIVRLLGVGEASARTLIHRLAGMGLLERDPGGRGYRLTPEGARVEAAITRTVRVYRPRLGIFEETTAIVVAGVPGPRSLVDVYRVRDYLVMEGCRESLIGGVNTGVPSYPGVPEELSRFLEAWDPGVEDGLVVLVPSGCLPRAFTAVLRLIVEHYCAGLEGGGVTGEDVS